MALTGSALGDQTWRLLNTQPQEVRDRYWREVPVWMSLTLTGTERNNLIHRLLGTRRPRAAFQVSSMDWKQIETSRLKRILTDIAHVNADREADLQINAFDISQALASLDGRTGVTSGEMAQLEFAFIDALEVSEHGIPNLEREIAKSPELFAQAVALVYKRTGGGQDPPEWSIAAPDQRAAVAMSAYRLLDGIRRIPGTDAGGDIQPESLRQWVVEVRRICAEYGRAGIGDHRIGQLLSRAPEEEENGVWPCRPICEVMETVGSGRMAEGFLIDTLNARGVSVRVVGEGGGQERALAAKYRGWAEQLSAFGYRFVGTILDDIGRSYEAEAMRWDSDAKVKQRLHVQ